MIDWLRREAIYLWYYLDIQVRQIAPYWALGILLGSAVSVFGKRYIHGAFARIGRRSMGWLGVITASLLGVASPLCMYGTIPIAASFSEQGVKDDYLAAFMMSSILLNPQLIFYSGALYQIHVPSDFVSGLFGKNEGFGVLMAATIGVPLYMCGGGTIPLLQQWLVDGMSMGSAAAFMITGPATKITNLGAVKIVLGWKRFALYLLYTMAFAWATGMIVNLLV